jgi:RHS repeat-associated protein
LETIDENVYENHSDEITYEPQVDLQPMTVATGNTNKIATYTYRANGLRRSKTVYGLTTTHVWDGANIVLELNANNNVINAFTRDARGNLIRSTQHGFYLFNARGDVMQRANAQGVIIHAYRYTAFGVEQNPTASDTNPFRFASMYWDDHTQTYMTPNRHFNPRIGRWTQPDPFWHIGNMQGNVGSILQAANLFVFVMNNPINFIDPSGLVTVLLSYIAEREGLAYRIVENRGFLGIVTSRHIEITYDGQTHTHRHSTVGDHLVISSRWLVDNFGFSMARATHQPGDIFSSTSTAALAWALTYYPHSNQHRRQREFSSNILLAACGGFYFDEPLIGERNRVRQREIRSDQTRAAIIHSHPQLWGGYRY